MRIDILTLFPDFFDGLKEHSIVGRAVGSGKVELHTHNLRQWATDSYGTVDDHPYGGGPGMVLRFDVLLRALTDVKAMPKLEIRNTKTILLTPQGEVYKQTKALELSKIDNLILICGHYEGFDERIRDYVDLELSIGDYVLTGGELAAMIVVDSVSRLLPGVLGDDTSSHEESHSPTEVSGQTLLEYPQYTRPSEYDGKKVPEILLSGNHPKIENWRKEQALIKTKIRRPDLLKTE
jgi:tRNA (guanine37-N1)-methyltransferase